MATPCGIIGTTGVGGLTLGGGIGHIARKHGLSIDSLLEADDGAGRRRPVKASEDENPDLFWAIRGGGGNFGVVTSFLFRMHPVNIVQAGPTFWPLEESAEVLRAYGPFIAAAPRELNGFFAFATVPPVPAFPEELHGRKVAGIVWCHTGTTEQARRTWRRCWRWATRCCTAWVRCPTRRCRGPSTRCTRGTPVVLEGGLRARAVRRGDRASRRVRREDAAGQSTMHLYPIDGAVHDVASSDTAFSYRDVSFAEVIVGVDPDPANAEAITRWTVEYWEATHPYSAGGAYVNFMMDEGQERVKATYGANYDRLTRVKAKYDPKNLFRVNQNIRPA